jgi:hypothetical protein
VLPRVATTEADPISSGSVKIGSMMKMLPRPTGSSENGSASRVP